MEYTGIFSKRNKKERGSFNKMKVRAFYKRNSGPNRGRIESKMAYFPDGKSMKEIEKLAEEASPEEYDFDNVVEIEC